MPIKALSLPRSSDMEIPRDVIRGGSNSSSGLGIHLHTSLASKFPGEGFGSMTCNPDLSRSYWWRIFSELLVVNCPGSAFDCCRALDRMNHSVSE